MSVVADLDRRVRVAARAIARQAWPMRMGIAASALMPSHFWSARLSQWV
jgi:hypothetical protein